MGRFLSCLILIVSLLSSSCSKKEPVNLAICAIFKNEAPWLKEWVDFHHLALGVNTFYLYNNDSEDAYREVLKPYIDKGIVELFEWSSQDPAHLAYGDFMDAPWSASQLGAYNDCLKNKALGKVDWVAMIDIDEFIVPKKGTKSFYNLLSKAKKDKKGSVSIHWKTFGTSNIKSLSPQDLLTEKMTWASLSTHPWNRHVKSIHRPEAVLFTLVHTPSKLKQGFGSRTFPNDQVSINHYWTRTEEFCERRRKISKEVDPKLFEELSLVEDKTIQQYIPLIKG